MSSPTSPASPAVTSPGKPRMLVVCFDGTANEYGGENTNVVKFFAMLRKDCDDEQMCYYQTGIGTYETPGLLTPLSMWVAKIADEAVAWYLDAHIMGGYTFLMNSYRPGDKISLFGFSRGAYTARALAGMLTKVGLLPGGNEEQVPFAYKMYTRTDSQGLAEAAGFKQTFCRPVGIDFLGVWDTVASTGIIKSRNLPFTTNNRLIKTFRQALSLDERRAKFVPTFWQFPAPSTSVKFKPDPGASSVNGASSNQKVEMPSGENGVSVVLLDTGSQVNTAFEPQLLKSPQKSSEGKPQKKKAWSISFKANRKVVNILEEIDPEEDCSSKCDVKEVWFSGCHSDVGGGADASEVATSLADIPLRWMVREVVASQCGVLFDAAAMDSYNVHVDLPASELFAQATGSNAIPSSKDTSADAVDALKPLHDELRLEPLWWILELVPLPFSWQDAKGVWHKRWEFHLGHGRYVEQTGSLLFHETVRMRMADTALGYTPRARYTKGTEAYVW
ncbi:hypothetical protein M0805_005909 [Coniferiporia weirii]|nr:hypothetical protein M0805_005909 [Coniferiporia weirii]